MKKWDHVGAWSINPSYPIHYTSSIEPYPTSSNSQLHVFISSFSALNLKSHTHMRFHDRCAKNMKIGRKPPLPQILIFSGVTLRDTPGSEGWVGWGFLWLVRLVFYWNGLWTCITIDDSKWWNTQWTYNSYIYIDIINTQYVPDPLTAKQCKLFLRCLQGDLQLIFDRFPVLQHCLISLIM